MARKVMEIRAPRASPVHPFDRLYGTETGGLIPRAELVTGSASDAHVTAYYGVAPSILDGVIDLWLQSGPPFGIDRYTFLDVGAGKGRAVMAASLHPFHRVVGVELNDTLAEVARRNLEAFAGSEAASPLAPAEIVTGDALQVPLPATPALAFLFHPFEAPVLRRFLSRVQQHFRQRPGSFDLIYVNAEHGMLLDRNEGFTRLFHGMVPMSPTDHLADLAEIAEQEEYGSTGDELCSIYRFTGPPA